MTTQGKKHSSKTLLDSGHDKFIWQTNFSKESAFNKWRNDAFEMQLARNGDFFSFKGQVFWKVFCVFCLLVTYYPSSLKNLTMSLGGFFSSSRDSWTSSGSLLRSWTVPGQYRVPHFTQTIWPGSNEDILCCFRPPFNTQKKNIFRFEIHFFFLFFLLVPTSCWLFADHGLSVCPSVCPSVWLGRSPVQAGNMKTRGDTMTD